MLSGLLGDLLPWIVGAVAALAAVWGYGKQQRKAGERDFKAKLHDADRKLANLTDKEIQDALDDSRAEPSALDRLRRQGRLREDDAEGMVRPAAKNGPNRRTRRH